MASQAPDHRDVAAPFSSPSSPQTSPHAAADAARAMNHTNSWQPSPTAFTRRQSWSKEDQKRELQMAHINDEVKTGPGFSERCSHCIIGMSSGFGCVLKTESTRGWLLLGGETSGVHPKLLEGEWYQESFMR